MTLHSRTVSSLANEKLKSTLLASQGKIAKLSNQITSGKASDNYTDLVGKTSVETLLSNKDAKRLLKSKVRNNTVLLGKLSEIERVEKALNVVVRESLKLCHRARNPGIAQGLDVVGMTKTQLEEIKLLLNTSFQGQKLFAGGKTEVAETVGDIVGNSNIVLGQVTANYYNGDDFKQSFAIARTRELKYGITANDPIFQNLIGAHHYLIAGNTDAALDMLYKAQGDIGTLIATTGTHAKTVLEQTDIDKDAILFLSEQISNVEDTDILVAMNQMTSLEAQLQASFMLTNKLAGLSLVQYLK